MNIASYLQSVNKRFQSGISREHSYRSDLEQLIRTLAPEVEVTNEPANVTDCGNPDYVISNKKIPIGYIEAKDLGKDLNSKGYKEQFTRYKDALDNLIITDYLWFQFFQSGELVFEVRIAEIENNSIKPIEANFTALENQIKDFCTYVGQTIKSSQKLAKMMASKARLFQDILEKATNADLNPKDLNDEVREANSTIQEQYRAFKEILIHDITPKAFADLYAQTLAYGMFAARLHDETLEDFSRQEAAELIPKSNPFLRKLFQYIAGYDIDSRIITPVENLADVFRATDIRELLKDFGKSTQQNDPIIHFYETFLAEYDPKLRKSRGVWYTPEPVVKFIVRAVDEVLKTEFDIKDGLADTSKTKVKVKTNETDKRQKDNRKVLEREVHKVQILDPATGTGTFLAEIIKYIYNNKFKTMQGVWSSYVEKDLIPRLNGFELLMASYAMAHLKLDLLLKDTGYKPKKEQRFRVYLTNSLEESHPDTGTLFANWLSTEANEANHIKRDSPIMCIIGNPPYSGESSNKGDWIMNLMQDYKKEPGGKEKLKEQNSKWINDDYVKFLRYGQHFIEKNGSGVLAFINPHGFLDNPTFRGMRWNLLKIYDKIYTIDLHGNSKKKETCPDGSKDDNVFDIMQGVSINIFIKTGKKKASDLGKVFHFDLFGKRDSKYIFLNHHKLNEVAFNELPNIAPNYFMVRKDFEAEEQYKKGFSLNKLFTINGVGLTTAHDDFVIKEDKTELYELYKEFQDSPRDAQFLHKKFNVRKKTGWNILEGYDNINNDVDLSKYIKPISYRPFDNRFIFYEDKLVWRTVRKVMQHFFLGDNLGLIAARQCVSDWRYIFISKLMGEFNMTGTAGRFGSGNFFPLYVYDKEKKALFDREDKRTPNLNAKIVEEIAKGLGLKFTNEKEQTKGTFAPIDILDYIYAVLHNPTYREKYKEFLKIDFPRVPYPKDADTFWHLVQLGKEIREIHLLEAAQTENYITTYPKDGNNVVRRKMIKTSIGYEASNATHGKVWINDEQYFDNVPLIAWEFYIGGYQPAQKWLKDRKDRELTFDDILHYQKIIVALTETDRLMKEIDKIEIE